MAIPLADSPSPDATVHPGRGERGGWRHLTQLTRPRLGLLGLVTVLLSAGLARSQAGTTMSVAAWLALAIGSALALAGASALNQCLELRPDGLMHRTARRPLPSGALSLPAALAFGLILCALGLAVLGYGVNPASAGWAMAGVASYLLVYTPAKRFSSLNTLIGALPGALPVPMGWAAVGRPGPDAAILFGLLFLWQIPHFLAIAQLYHQDYERAGFRMLGRGGAGGGAVGRQVMLYSTAMAFVPFLLVERSFAGPVFAFSAAVLGIWFLRISWRFARGGSPREARRLLRASVIYLPLIFIALVVDRLA
jgi:protoheme IX farnesyltransferase